MTEIVRLLAIMARLRDREHGCPWDALQTFATIAPYTIEEAYEVEDAIRREDRTALREELGDLLLQVVFHARMAEEEGAFVFADVVETLCEKLERRHPHVFGNATIDSAGAQTEAWEALKAEERAVAATRTPATGVAASAFDGLPLGLPVLPHRSSRVERDARTQRAPAVARPRATGAAAVAAGRRALDSFAAGGRTCCTERRIERPSERAAALGALLRRRFCEA